MSLTLPLSRPLTRRLTRPLVRQPEFDADALAFFLRASVTDSAGRAQVNSFISGMKALGEWGSVYNAWTLRNYQAGGLSSTLYGLKPGNDGTLTNGPTWGATGITFDQSNDYISISGAGGVFRNTNAGCAISVYKKGSSVAGQDAFFVSLGSSGTSPRARLQSNNKSAQVRRLDADSNTTTTAGTGDTNRNYDELRLDWAAGTAQVTSNGVAVASPSALAGGAGSTSDTDSVTVNIGATGVPSSYFGGEISFVMFMRSLPSLAKAEQIRTLYKSTLGAGLGLS